jgi:hypothetical protein
MDGKDVTEINRINIPDNNDGAEIRCLSETNTITRGIRKRKVREPVKNTPVNTRIN